MSGKGTFSSFCRTCRGESRLNGRPLGEGLTTVCGVQPFEVVLPPMDMRGLTITRELMDEHLERTSRAAKMLKALVTQHHGDPVALADEEGLKAVIASVLDILVPVIIGAEPSADYGWCNRHEIVHRTREYILDRIGAPLQIKDVIDRWGFWHPSRFSCEYRQMFAELPSETLRRCRAA